MDDQLKQQIIQTLQSLHGRLGEPLQIEDWISTGGRNYDRHFTSYSKIILTLEQFHVRFSGAIATLGNNEQQIEFQTDAIKHIQADLENLVIEIQLSEKIWRRICIKPLP